MAFTASQKVSLIKILGINAITLDAHLAAYAEYITAEMETDVIAEIARWTDGTQTGRVWVDANTKNWGANVSAANTAASADPKTMIERLLFFESSSPYDVALVRG